jgi:hypothetical protein
MNPKRNASFPTSTVARRHADFLTRLDGRPRKVVRNGGRVISFDVAIDHSVAPVR